MSAHPNPGTLPRRTPSGPRRAALRARAPYALARYALALLVASAAVAACHSGTTGSKTDEVPAAQPLVIPADAATAARAVASLRRLDEHPLYQMTYEGPAPLLAGEPGASGAAGAFGAGSGTGDGRTGALRGTGSRTPAPAFGCTVFLAAGTGGHPVVGRNFDWQNDPALVLHVRPTDGRYASVSMVDLAFAGFDRTSLGDLNDPQRRGALLRAIAVPIDGMNERGLTIGMAAVPAAVTQPRPGRPTVGSLGVMRLVLDRAATLAEAVAIFGGYTVDFTGGPPLHYLVADASGTSAIIEYVDGRMRVLPGTGGWQLMTNFQLSTTPEADRSTDWRYLTGSARLDAAAGALDRAGALDILRAVTQDITLWSVVYDLTGHRAVVVTDRATGPVHEIPLAGPVTG